MDLPDADALRERFEATGFIGPVPILEPSEAARLARRLAKPFAREWKKGGAAASWDYYLTGTNPAIVDRVAAMLGEDVMLWGAKLVVRRPGQVHPWHTDLETAEGPGRTVSVWLGLRNVSLQSSLQVIPYSHLFGVTVQELKQRRGHDGVGVMVDEALGWARQYDSRCEVVQHPMGDGDAIFFDGRLWHGTDNQSPKEVRTALLLQYATPDRPVRIPDYTQLAWPFRFQEDPLPPCLMVRGTDFHGVNRMVPPPRPANETSSWVRQLTLPLARDPDSGWRAHPIHHGPTSALSRFTCHASVLEPGATPHEPHAHPEEEVLVVLDGEATLLIGPTGASIPEPVGRGALAYYPSGQSHTLTNRADRPVTYLMFKWRGAGTHPAGEAMGVSLHRPDDSRAPGRKEKAGGRVVEPLFDGPTEFLRCLHAHRSLLSPGGGYEPHVDAYDVALVVLKGTIETLGKPLGPGGVVFYAAGDAHGIRNVGDDEASYLVFEFHGAAGEGEGGRAAGGIFAGGRARIRRFIPREVRRALRRAVGSLARRLPGGRE